MAMELDATGLGPAGGARADDQQVTLVAETTPGAPPSGTPQTTTIELDAAGGAVHLPAGTDTSHPVQVGNDLEFIQPDGSIILIPNGAVAGLVVFVGDVEIPADAVAALFSANNITPAEGGQGGAGGAHGNFNDPGPQGIGQSFTVSDLLAPSSLSFDAGTGEDTPQNTPPIFRGPITALVAEEAFPGGNEDTDGNTDTLGALTVYHGNMGGFDADGNPLLYSLTPPPSGSLSSDGFPVDNWVGSGTGDLTGYNSHGDKVLNISIDNATGDFTVTLFQAVDHPNDTTTVTPEDALSIVFGATVQDVPAGATAHTTLTLTIEDDSAIIVPSAAGPNLIENGDFQFGFTLNGNIWGTGSGEATGTVPGWTIVQTDNSGPNVLERIGADFPDDGLTPSTSYMVDLEATYGNIVISQTVAGVTEGQPYTLKFEAGSPSYAPTGSTILEVYFNGDLVDRIDPTHAMQTYTYTVVGGAGPNTLSFKEVGEPQEGYGTYLANISLQTSNAFIVDEDALGGGNPGGDGDVVAGAMTTGSLNISWGADNFNNVIDGGINGSPANGDRSVTFATDVVSTLEHRNLSSHGIGLDYEVSPNGTLLTAYRTEGGLYFDANGNETDHENAAVFTVELSDQNSGSFKFTLLGTIDHSTTSTEDNLSLDLGFVATDSDQDPTSGSFTVAINDDMPVATGETVTGTADEDDLADFVPPPLYPLIEDFWQGSLGTSPYDGSAPDDSHTGLLGTVPVWGNLSSIAKAGADGPGQWGIGSVADAELWMQTAGANGGELKSHGDVINDARDITIPGIGEAMGFFASDGRLVFGLFVGEDGLYNFRLFDQLDHPLTDNPTTETHETAFQDTLTLDFSKLVTYSDFDGDTVGFGDGTITIKVMDDVPVQISGATAVGIVEEEQLAGGNDDATATPDIDNDNSIPFIGKLVTTNVAIGDIRTLVNPGADETGTGFLLQPAGKFFLSTDTAGLPALTSNHQAVSYVVVGNTLTAYVDNGDQTFTADDAKVFTLTVAEGGAYEFRLLDQIDHADANVPHTEVEDVLDLNLTSVLRYSDSDGDTIGLSGNAFTIRIIDDMPINAGLSIHSMDTDSQGGSGHIQNTTLMLDETAGVQSAAADADDSSDKTLEQDVATLPAVFSSVTALTGLTGYAFASRDNAVTIAPHYGADLPGTLAVSLTQGTGAAFTGQESGLTDSQSDLHIFLFSDASGVVLGRMGLDATAAASGTVVFAIGATLSGNSVTLSMVEYRGVEHQAVGDRDDSVLMNKVYVTATQTDADGDQLSNTSGSPVVIGIDDDGPTLSVSTVESGYGNLAIELDETVGTDRYNSGESEDAGGNANVDDAAGVLARVTTNVVGGLASFFSAPVSYGADGPGSFSGTFAFVNVPSGGLATNLSATHGGAIVLKLVGGDLVGYDNNGAGDAVFTIKIVQPTPGVYQLETTLSEAISHSDANLFDGEQLLKLLGEGSVGLKYTVAVTDGDGDPISQSATLPLITASGSPISFDDDGPKLTVTGVGGFSNGLFFDGFVSNSPAWGQGSGINTTGAAGAWSIQPSTVEPAGTVQLERVGDGYRGADSPSNSTMVDLEASPGNVQVSQALTGLTVGEHYHVTFEIGAANDAPIAVDSAVLQVLWNNVVVGTYHPTSGVMQIEALDLVATQADNVLTFREVGDAGDNTGTFLGNVRVTDVIVIDETAGKQGDEVDGLASAFLSVASKGTDPGMAVQYAQGAHAILAATPDYGSDGAAAANPLVYAFTLPVPGANSGLTTTEGNAIVLSVESGIVVGRVVGGSDDGQAAFALAINPASGVVSVAQFLSLHHPNTGSTDEAVYLAANTVSVTVTATDGDGDHISQTTDVSGLVGFRDDGPIPTQAVQSHDVYESELITGTNLVDDDKNGDGGHGDAKYTGNLSNLVSFGADGHGSFVVETANLAPELLALTSGGAHVTYTVDQWNTLIGWANGVEVLEFNVDPSNGQYFFWLKGPLDHLDANDSTIVLDMSSAVRAVDGDGDSVALSGQLSITVHDDAPVVGPPQAPVWFTDSFDGAPTGGYFDGPPDGYGHVSLLSSGTNGITTKSGAGNYALLTQSGTLHVDATGPFTRFDGYKTDFQGGYVAKVDVYIDPANWGLDKGFDYSVAANGQDGNHVRDFIFHLTGDGSGHVLVGADNNSGDENGPVPAGTLAGYANHASITQSGWYTLEHVFHAASDGSLAVDLVVLDKNGNTVFTQTLNQPSDSLEDIVGGNRYGWFTTITVDGGLPVDNLSLSALGAQVDEDDLGIGSDTAKESTSVTGGLNIAWGADNRDADGSATADRHLVFTTAGAPAGLKSQGVAVEYEVGTDANGNGVLIAYRGAAHDDAQKVFMVTLNDDATGSYTFTLQGNLDHPTDDGQNDLPLSFNFNAIDSDGDAAGGSFTVSVHDDVPTAHAEDPVVFNEDGSTSGNVLANDVQGADGATLTDVKFSGDADFTALSSLTPIGGVYTVGRPEGTYTFKANGDWSFTPAHDYSGPAGFSYEITDGDGDKSDPGVGITIAVSPVNDPPVINEAESVTMGAVTEAGDLPGINEAGPTGSLDLTAALAATAAGNANLTAALAGVETSPSTVPTALDTIQTELGVDRPTAIAILWNDLDGPYVTSGPDQANINEAFARLGIAYAAYLHAADPKLLVDVTAKYTGDFDHNGVADRNQSLHDNLLGNITTAALQQRFPGNPALVTELSGEISAIDPALLSRSYASGNQGSTGVADAHAFDLAHGLVTTATGTLIARDPDIGDGKTWSIEGGSTGQYGSITIDATTGKWIYVLDNSLAATQALAQGEPGVPETFTARVTDSSHTYDEIAITVNVTGSNDAPVITSTETAPIGSGTLNGFQGADAAHSFDLINNIDGSIQSALAAHPADMAQVLSDVQATLGGTRADAIAAVWDYVDDHYSYYDTAINEVGARLGIEYAKYLLAGNPPLTGILAKYLPDGADAGLIPDRQQTLHDNLLGNLSGPSLIDKLLGAGQGSNPNPDPAGYQAIIDLLHANGLDALVDRPYYGGNEGNDPTLTLAWDQDHGFFPLAQGQINATDVDHNTTLTWTATGPGVYGAFVLDGAGAWHYTVADNAATRALAQGQSATEIYTVTVTDEHGGIDTIKIPVTINGVNDAPTISGPLSGSTLESGDIAGVDEAGRTGGLEPAPTLLTPAITTDLATLLTTPGNLTAVLSNVTAALGGTGHESQAIAVIWDYLDDIYVSAGPNQIHVNEAFTRLGVAYAAMLKAGTIGSLIDVTAKYTPDNGDADLLPQRNQSLHDNLLGNLTNYALDQRYGTADTGLRHDLSVLIQSVDNNLLTRDYFEGSQGESDATERAWDVQHGYVPMASGQLTVNDVDAGDTHTWSNYTASGTYGTFTLDASGKWTYVLDDARPETQALSAGEIETETFSVTVTDNHGASATQQVTITVTGNNDAPVAHDDNFSLVPDTWTLATDGSGHVYKFVQLNDTSTDWATARDQVAGLLGGNAYLATITSGTENNIVLGVVTTAAGSNVIAYLGGSDAGQEGTWKWVTGPEAGQTFYVGTNVSGSSALYTNWDSTAGGEPNDHGGAEDILWLYGNFRNGTWNDAPITGGLPFGGYVFGSVAEAGAPGSFYAAFDEDHSASIAAALLLQNDTDVDRDVLTVSSVAATSSHGASVSLSGGVIHYDPTAAASVQALGAQDTLTDSFTYTVTDGHGGTDTATVTLTVYGVNDAPTDIALGGTGVPADNADGTVVGSVTVTDVDSTAFTFDTHDANFAVTGTPGNYQLVLTGHVDTLPPSITITATDDGGLSYSESFALTLPIQLFDSSNQLIASYSTIQGAVNGATGDAGQYIVVPAGTYNEDVNVDRGVEIRGAHAGEAGTDAGRGSDESVINGRWTIDTTQAVDIDGFRFNNSSPEGSGSDATIAILKGGDGVGHRIENTVFYSDVDGGDTKNTSADGDPVRDDRAIFISNAAVDGHVVIDHNLITGDSTGKYSTASWGRGIWSDGGGTDLTISNNTIDAARSAINLDDDRPVNSANPPTHVTGNTFDGVGTAISLGANWHGDISSSFSDNTFTNVDLEFNAQNLSSGISLDAGAGVAGYGDLPGDGVDNDAFQILGGSAGDALVGTSAGDWIVANGGADDITGGGADDVIIGGTGVDTTHYVATLSADKFSFDTLTQSWTLATATAEGTDHLQGVEIATDGTHRFLLVGGGGFAHIQDAIDAAHPGDTILVAPGTYVESHTTASGPAGLYINTPDLTLRGFSSVDGGLITSESQVQAGGPLVISGAQNNFGANHWIDTGGTNTVIEGLHLQAGPETNNKLLEVWADNVTLKYDFIDVNSGGTTYTYAAAVYLNDNGTTASDTITRYTIDHNVLNEGIIVSNGVGAPPSIGANQQITNNQFIGTFDPATGEGRYDTVVINGQVAGIGWLLEPSQTPTITGNSFANNTTPFLLRGSDNDAANLPSAAQIQAILDSNGDANLRYVYVVDGAGHLVTALRNDGSGDYHSFAVTNTIDTLNLALDNTSDNVFGGRREYEHAGDTLIVQSGATGTVNSAIMVEDLTVIATVNSADLNLTLATTYADGTPIPGGGVIKLTLGDYAPGAGANVDVTGNALDNVITDNSGHNALSGLGGNDTFNIGADVDAGPYGPRNIALGTSASRSLSLTGLAGTADTIDGGAGTSDKIVLDAGTHNGFVLDDYNYPGGVVGVEQIEGTSGNDIILMANGYVSDAAGGGVTIDGNAGIDAIQGGAGNDTLDGGSGNDLISGLGGNDTIIGGLGDDEIYAGAGNDGILYTVGDGNDFVDGGTETGTTDPDYDVLTINGDGEARNITIGSLPSGDAGNIVPVDGTDSADVTITYDGTNGATLRADEIEHIHVVAGTGAVNLTINDLSGTAIQPSTIDFTGGTGGDTVHVTDLHHHVVADGGDGTDSAVFDFAYGAASYAEIRDQEGHLIGVTVTTGAGEQQITDEFRNFESFSFSDGTRTLEELFGDAPGNDAPAITHLDPLTYYENEGVRLFDPAVTVSDPDSPNLNGGSLTVSFSANGTSADQLGVNPAFQAPNGQITVSNGNLAYQPLGPVASQIIGTVSGGTNGTPLVFSFTSDLVTPVMAEAVIEAVTYANGSDNPSTATRTVSFALDDGDGGVGTSTTTIQVIATNDLPRSVASLSVISNWGGASFTVPDAAFLAFASDAEGEALSITNVAEGGGQFTKLQHDTDTVTIDDNSVPGGLFSYGVTDGQVTAGPLSATYQQDFDDKVINGTAGNDILVANDDAGLTLDGKGGGDALIGGAADDLFVADQSDYLIDGRGGTDTLQVGSNFTDRDDSQLAHIEKITIAGSTGIALDLSHQSESLTINGSSGSDTIIAGAGNDTIVGAQNDARLDGGGGRDTLEVSADFTPGTDDQIQHIENITITGGTGRTVDLSNQLEAFKVVGSSGADVIRGGFGADIIDGGAGNDTLTGNNGADQFRLRSDGGTDTITDFQYGGSDKLGFLNTTGVSVYNAFGQIQQSLNNQVIILTTGFTSSSIQLASPNALNSYVVVFNSTTNRGEVWFDTNWNNGDVRVLVGILSNITTKQGFDAAVIAGNIVSYSDAADPVILDLDHNGYSFSALDRGVQFDINADGHKDQVAWNTSNDGILAIDVNGDGKIDSGQEIFTPDFNGGHFASGSDALASLDSNHDGLVDASDVDFSRLLIWQDGNADGVSETSELSTLADHDIVSISAPGTPTDDVVDGQSITATGTFTLSDGTSGSYVEAALDTSFGSPSPLLDDGASVDWGNVAVGKIDVVDTLHGTDGTDKFTLTDLHAVDFIADYDFEQGDSVDLSAVLGNNSGARVDNAADYLHYDNSTGHLSVDADGAANGANFVDVAILNTPVADVKIILDDGVDVTINHIG